MKKVNLHNFPGGGGTYQPKGIVEIDRFTALKILWDAIRYGKVVIRLER